MVSNPFEQNLEKNPANYQPLTPLSFLSRTALASPNHTAIIHGNARYSYAEFYARSRRLGSALSLAGIGPGDTVSVMLANTPPMLEAHYRRRDDRRRAAHDQHASRSGRSLPSSSITRTPSC